MTTATKTAPMTNSVGLTLLAGLPLFTLLPLGLDIFLPAVYQIGEFFSDQGVPSMAISIYMLFWGLGQLFWGGMADTIGKKNIALIGLALFAFSSFMISTIDSDQAMQFLAFRALQSFAGSACFTAIFALIRMRFEGEHLNKATVTLMVFSRLFRLVLRWLVRTLSRQTLGLRCSRSCRYLVSLALFGFT
ncbi:multidrug resistance transporter, Bcr/CflA family [Vibrio sp. JCM 19052]|nr:multidrug resistance transporter, Bcr/CflA family [Vibrio sp. JCM 19052]